MSSAHDEPSAKRRRLVDGQNAAQQHFSVYSASENILPSYTPDQTSSSSYLPHPNAFTGNVIVSQYQRTADAVRLPNPVQAQPVFYRSYGVSQPWEGASTTQNQSAWGRMPRFDPMQVPLMPPYGHVWPSYASILPMPHHFDSPGVPSVSFQNHPPLPVETTPIPYPPASVLHQECPSFGHMVEYGPANDTAGLSPETAGSSVGEIVCFGMV